MSKVKSFVELYPDIDKSELLTIESVLDIRNSLDIQNKKINRIRILIEDLKDYPISFPKTVARDILKIIKE